MITPENYYTVVYDLQVIDYNLLSTSIMGQDCQEWVTQRLWTVLSLLEQWIEL